MWCVGTPSFVGAAGYRRLRHTAIASGHPHMGPVVKCEGVRQAVGRLGTDLVERRRADPLLVISLAAAPRASIQPKIAADLAAIAEILVKHLVGQRARECR